LNALAAGVFDSALVATERAHAIGTAIGDARIVAGAGYVTAWAHALRGEHDRAVATAECAVEASRDPTAWGLASGALGYAQLRRGNSAAAVKVLQEVVEHFKRIPFRPAAGRHMAYLSEAYLMTGERERARTTAEEALELGLADRSDFTIGLAERALGRIEFSTASFAQARKHLARALSAFTECEATFEMGLTHLDFAALFAAENDPTTAEHHLKAGEAIFAAANVPMASVQRPECSEPQRGDEIGEVL